MNTQSRIILFLFFCMTLRTALVLLAKFGSNLTRQVLAVFTLAVSLGFMYQFLFHPKKLGAFGGKPWWNNLRPVHAFLYLLFTIFVFTGLNDTAWLILLLDIIIGIIAFTFHYF